MTSRPRNPSCETARDSLSRVTFSGGTHIARKKQCQLPRQKTCRHKENFCRHARITPLRVERSKEAKAFCAARESPFRRLEDCSMASAEQPRAERGENEQ